VQLVIALLPAGDVLNEGHTRHTASSVAPMLVEYLPASQSVHAALPDVDLNLPAAQAVQVTPLGPVKPRLQVQFERAVLPMGELVVLGHERHALVPVMLLYLPIGHNVHAGEVPVYPTGHSATAQKNAELAVICPVLVCT